MISMLQRVSREITWMRFFRISWLHVPHELSDIIKPETKRKIDEYNALGYDISLMLKQDYELYKQKVLEHRKQLKKESNK